MRLTAMWVLAALTQVGAARAAVCGSSDLIATFPAHGSTAVPVNANLSAVYATTAEHLAETVDLEQNGEREPFAASFDAAEHRLSVDAPPPPLLSNTAYVVHWPGLRGSASGVPGRGKDMTFSTSSAVDEEPPEFEGVTRLDWELVHPRDACTDEREPRYRFTFHLGSASDDGGRENLALLLFQSVGPLLDTDTPRVISLGALPPDGVAKLDLPEDEGRGDVCFSVLTRDLLGRISATASDEHCVKTAAAPFFYGCRLGAPGVAHHGAALAIAAFSITLLCRRKRSRDTRRSLV